MVSISAIEGFFGCLVELNDFLEGGVAFWLASDKVGFFCKWCVIILNVFLAASVFVSRDCRCFFTLWVALV